ncbi:hypothetical protein K438DRAFT_1784834 [Mycena galopus ATCC 62051]|nr:hypothetical protein K438DRAFT_1784834 [Mycena galopus ATCC 62051]
MPRWSYRQNVICLVPSPQGRTLGNIAQISDDLPTDPQWKGDLLNQCEPSASCRSGMLRTWPKLSGELNHFFGRGGLEGRRRGPGSYLMKRSTNIRRPPDPNLGGREISTFGGVESFLRARWTSGRRRGPGAPASRVGSVGRRSSTFNLRVVESTTTAASRVETFWIHWQDFLG